MKAQEILDTFNGKELFNEEDETKDIALCDEALKKIQQINEVVGRAAENPIAAVKEIHALVVPVKKIIEQLKSREQAEQQEPSRQDIEALIKWAKDAQLYSAQNETKLSANAFNNLFAKLSKMKRGKV